VLHKPIELFEFAFITLLDGLHLKFGDGLNIQTQSNIPIGCGMGSSAATILSLLRGIGHYFRVEFRPDWFLKYSMEAEKLQHGFPSGVDSYISLHGGCALFQNGEATSVPLPRLAMYLVNTGTPAATTGECVVAVKNRFECDVIWNDFEAVTLGLEQAVRAPQAGRHPAADPRKQPPAAAASAWCRRRCSSSSATWRPGRRGQGLRRGRRATATTAAWCWSCPTQAPPTCARSTATS
jgi:hypothetical protein